MTAANCGIILSGQFSTKTNPTLPGVGVWKALKVTGMGWLPPRDIAFAFNLNWCCKTSCVCYRSHILSQTDLKKIKIAQDSQEVLEKKWLIFIHIRKTQFL